MTRVSRKTRMCGFVFTELMETIAKDPKERLGILTAEIPGDEGVWYLLVLLFRLSNLMKFLA